MENRKLNIIKMNLSLNSFLLYLVFGFPFITKDSLSTIPHETFHLFLTFHSSALEFRKQKKLKQNIIKKFFIEFKQTISG